MKKITSFLMVSVLSIGLFTGCGTQSALKGITVVSREDGSGTRGAFTELLGVSEKSADGKVTDKTTTEALIANQTNVMIVQVAQSDSAIGYISLGSLNDKVKAVDVDGVKPTAENVKNGTYKVSRPFNIAIKGEATGLTKDFIDFILSADGQNVVAKSYIKVDDAAKPYVGTKPSGKISVAGSSSVTPIMEKLKEAYVAINPSATIEVQQSDSTAGMKAALDGTANIGMASRGLKESELASLKSIPIALDGIAIIVNNSNTVTNLTKDQISKIYKGEIVKWNELTK